MHFYNLRVHKSKLKAVTRTSALLSGFALTAMVELNFNFANDTQNNQQSNENQTSILANNTNSLNNQANQKKQIPDSVYIIFSLTTCLLIGVHMLALMISTCILPQLEASTSEPVDTDRHLIQHEFNFLNQTVDYSNFETNKTYSYLKNNSKSKLKDIAILNDREIVFPYQNFHKCIEAAWIMSTIMGIFLFIVEIGFIVYIQFYPISHLAALTGVFVMIPILILFIIFTIVFYKRLAHFKIGLSKKIITQLEEKKFREYVI
ncbi:unnamed protein product [Brachionus calyciflorus]|uniref:Uncharacterized protein n=1 Tax=Brachionus calyciflorus TaxID=104777 RepID=A0A814B1E7_9BILA|nr:unnamed protein product [Brachionus calyciflorus]